MAGNTKVFAIRGSKDGDFTTRELLRGIDFAIGAARTCST